MPIDLGRNNFVRVLKVTLATLRKILQHTLDLARRLDLSSGERPRQSDFNGALLIKGISRLSIYSGPANSDATADISRHDQADALAVLTTRIMHEVVFVEDGGRDDVCHG